MSKLARIAIQCEHILSINGNRVPKEGQHGIMQLCDSIMSEGRVRQSTWDHIIQCNHIHPVSTFCPRRLTWRLNVHRNDILPMRRHRVVNMRLCNYPMRPHTDCEQRKDDGQDPLLYLSFWVTYHLYEGAERQSLLCFTVNHKSKQNHALLGPSISSVGWGCGSFPKNGR